MPSESESWCPFALDTVHSSLFKTFTLGHYCKNTTWTASLGPCGWLSDACQRPNFIAYTLASAIRLSTLWHTCQCPERSINIRVQNRVNELEELAAQEANAIENLFADIEKQSKTALADMETRTSILKTRCTAYAKLVPNLYSGTTHMPSTMDRCLLAQSRMRERLMNSKLDESTLNGCRGKEEEADGGLSVEERWETNLKNRTGADVNCTSDADLACYGAMQFGREYIASKQAEFVKYCASPNNDLGLQLPLVLDKPKGMNMDGSKSSFVSFM